MAINPIIRFDHFFRNHPWWRWFLVIIVILFASFAILVPVIAHWQIEKWLKENGEDQVKIEGVTFNPFIMRLRVHSLFAEGVQSGRLQWKRMAFETNLWPLHRRRFVIEDFVLRDAIFTVQQTKSGDWVVGGIRFRIGNAKNNRSKKGKNGWEFGVSNLALTNVRILYRGPLLNQQIVIRKAEIDTFRNWEVNKKSRFSIQARIDGGDITFSGTTDPQGGNRSVASTITIDALPLRWISPALDSLGLPGINGVLDADFQVQGNLRTINQFNLKATGQMTLSSVRTAVTTLPYTIGASRIGYEGTFRMTNSLPVQLDDALTISELVVRDTLRDVLILLFDGGRFLGIKVDSLSNVAVKSSRFEGLKSLAYTSSSEQQKVGPFAIETGVFAVNTFSFITKRPEIVIGSIDFRSMNVTLVHSKNDQKQLPPSEKKEKPDNVKSTSMQFSVNRFTIGGNSRAEFLDLSISPPASLQAVDLDFELNEFSTDTNQVPGRYTLTAMVRPDANLRAEGTISSFFPKPSTTINSQMNNFRLTQLSSYIRNFFGYEIDSGRLDVIATGEIRHGKLDINNQITIHQLEISPVPSESAYEKHKNAFAGMSLESALSILTDNQGNVKLNIPLNGDISDPEFNVNDIVRTAIINSISGGLNSVYRQ